MKRILALLLSALLLAGCSTQIQGNTPTEPSESSLPSSAPTVPSESSIPTETTAPKETQVPTAPTTLPETTAPSVPVQTGWVTKDGKTYYIHADGSYARGKVNIEGLTYYFAKSGEQILVVNPWHFVPYDYAPNLVYIEGYIVESSCRDALAQMLTDCRKAGYDARICSAYRTQEDQIYLYNRKVNYYLDLNYSPAAAREEAAKVIAVPGTSEHQLGLAVDLVDNSNWALDESQEKTPAQKWLMAHCWEYGFILRYPNGKTDKTGIIYEPWHYRYVGKELAMELKGTGLCLEEYFDILK